MTTLLQANHLGLRGRRHTNWLFKDVNLEINSGDLIIIYGNSGAGKTRLADVLCGFKKPSQGFVAKNAPVGITTQEFTLYKDLTVEENLDFFATIYDYPAVELPEIIELNGLIGWEKTRAGRLPSGLRKMLQIACTLIQKTPLVVFDEPICGLDQPLTDRFAKLVKLMAGEERGLLIMTNQKIPGVVPTHELVLKNGGLMNFNPVDNEKKTGYGCQSEGVG